MSVWIPSPCEHAPDVMECPWCCCEPEDPDPRCLYCGKTDDVEIVMSKNGWTYRCASLVYCKYGRVAQGEGPALQATFLPEVG